MRNLRHRAWSDLLRAAPILLLSACGSSEPPLEEPSAQALGCAVAVSTQVAACHSDALADQNLCLETQNVPCLEAIVPAANRLIERVGDACNSGESIRLGGFGPGWEPGAFARQQAQGCADDIHRLVARNFGGPQASLVTQGPTDGEASCLQGAFEQSSHVFAAVYDDYAQCALDPACGIDPAMRAVEHQTDAAIAVDAACPARGLGSVLGTPTMLHLHRAVTQAECAVALAHGDTARLGLRCGPDNTRLAGIEIRNSAGEPVDQSLHELPRGESFQLIMDSDVWGTSCGDGSPYAPWLRLAPEPARMDSILIHLEGAGACAAGTCANTDPAKFQSLGDHPEESFGGYMRVRADNPFANRSLLYLPSCNQDLFVGGGVDDPGPGPSGRSPIYRYGGVNLRAALEILRDVVWQRVRASDPLGYRPDQWDVFFSGTSSGGYGVQYNLHYVLDELRWRNTVAQAHAAIVQGGGLVPNFDTFFALIGQTWGQQPYLPPYCFADECAKSDVIIPRHLERLLEVSRQRLMLSSAQNDHTQARTQGFMIAAGGVTLADNREQWINGLRDVYCQLRGDPALQAFLPANLGEGIHGFINKDEFYDTSLPETQQALADGVHIFDWMDAVVNGAIDEAVDRVEEGELTIERPRVQGFACGVAP